MDGGDVIEVEVYKKRGKQWKRGLGKRKKKKKEKKVNSITFYTYVISSGELMES